MIAVQELIPADAPPAIVEAQATPPRGGLNPVGRINLATMGFEEMQRISRVLVECGFYEKEIRTIAQAVGKLMVGQELGLTVFEAMTGLRFLEGKLEMTPALMAARINASRDYSYEIERIDRDEDAENPTCIIAFYKGKNPKDRDLLGRSEFSQSDTVKARLHNKDVWQKYGRNMRFSRAMGNGAKWYCGDVFGGAVFVEGEIESPQGREMSNVSAATISNITPAPALSVVGPSNVETKLQATIDLMPPEVEALRKSLQWTPRKVEAELRKLEGDVGALIDAMKAATAAAQPARAPQEPPVKADVPANSDTAGVITGAEFDSSIPAGGGEAGKYVKPVITDQKHRAAILRAVRCYPGTEAERLADATSAFKRPVRSFNELTIDECEAFVTAFTPAAPVVEGSAPCVACLMEPGQAHFASCPEIPHPSFFSA